MFATKYCPARNKPAYGGFISGGDMHISFLLSFHFLPMVCSWKLLKKRIYYDKKNQ
jgi:hypothetical protein